MTFQFARVIFHDHQYASAFDFAPGPEGTEGNPGSVCTNVVGFGCSQVGNCAAVMQTLGLFEGMEMQGVEARRIRESLGEVVGRPLSERELGMMLGLSEQLAEATVRAWEEGAGPNGSAAVALWLLALSTDDDDPPAHVLAEGADYTPPGAKPDVAFKAMMGALVRDLAAQTRE